MKVYIGPYTKWVGPYQIADMIFFWINRRGIFADDDPRHKRWDYKAADWLGDKLADSWVSDFCNWVSSKNKRKIKVRIDQRYKLEQAGEAQAALAGRKTTGATVFTLD
jgi:NADPH:quinone reductase-like Zn-dependent oxidoreductase